MQAVESLTNTLSVDETAARLGISSMTVRRMIKRGQLNAKKVIGRSGTEWRITLDEQLIGTGVTAAVQVSNRGDQPAFVGDLVALVSKLTNRCEQLETERGELLHKLGHLTAQLEASSQRLALLEAPQAKREQRPWWKFWG